MARYKALVCQRQRAYRHSGLRTLQQWLKGKKLHWALYLFLASLLVVGILGLHSHLRSYMYVVRADGHEVGLVRDAEEVELFVEDLMEQCSSLYGMKVMPRQAITLTREFRAGMEADPQRVMENLRQRISLITEAVMVMVDGSPVVPVSTEQDVEMVAELLCWAYVSEDENVMLLEAELVEEITGEKYTVPPEQVCTPENVASLLTRRDQDQEQLIASRDVLISRFGRNAPEDIYEAEVPVVHVITVEQATLEEQIPFPTTYVNNSNMLIGENRVLTAGAEGRKEVTYRITRENGVETARETLSEQVIKEPVTQVVERGTGRRFTWPVSGGGRLTQGFRGSAHMGIDIASSTGTPILAADGGFVVQSQNAWPMGNFIVLNHGSYWTVYLHHSRNLVSVGQRVSRGQTIAYMGSTGNSTGPHLHFEIRRSNGSGVWSSWHAHPAINPMQFFR
ncbi:MAG: peptidoglycan DD-metalloendopeptidase family protein [Bacillota bacterium]